MNKADLIKLRERLRNKKAPVAVCVPDFKQTGRKWEGQLIAPDVAIGTAMVDGTQLIPNSFALQYAYVWLKSGKKGTEPYKLFYLVRISTHEILGEFYTREEALASITTKGATA